MALKFNTFRARRYLRSRFVEGKFLLAAEASDIELEILDRLRQSIEESVGDVFIEDAWKVEKVSDTTLRVKAGEAWFRGLPVVMRSGRDHLVTGSSLVPGLVPAGVTITDDPANNGKLITFNDSATTPTNEYKIVLSVEEQLITFNDDEFLQNANLSEDTAQKMRLVVKINIVDKNLQTETPIPYTNDTSDENLVNQIIVTPTAAGNGELVATNLLSGSEQIDGRDLELVLRNDPALGGGNPIPNGLNDQQAYFNGQLIDSRGESYWINAIFNDTISTQVVIRIDKEVNQPNPEIVNGVPCTHIKRDEFSTEDVNGTPIGKIFVPIADLNWNQTLGIDHADKITDLRNTIQKEVDSQELIHTKFDLTLTGGGELSYNVVSTETFSFGADLELINPAGLTQTITANDISIVEGGSIVYEMNVASGGGIGRGNVALTAVSSGTTVTFSGVPDLSNVRVGNIYRVGSELAVITNVNDVSKTITLASSVSGTGAATIFQDSFGPGLAPKHPLNFTLAVRNNDKVFVEGGLELEQGERNEISDGISIGLLTYIGAAGENDEDPNYSSASVVTQGNSLTAAIGELDASLASVLAALAAPLYDERIQYPTGLAANTNITIPLNSRDGNVQETYVPGSGDLEIYVNQLFKFEDADWESVDNETIRILFDLPNDAEVHFRKDSVGGGAAAPSSPGTATLQSAYNNGRTITTTSGNPISISGPASEKLLVVNGDMDVTGVIDPTALEFTPQSSNPLGVGQLGLWVNDDEDLIFERDAEPTQNITQKIIDLETGFGVNSLNRTMFNSTGSTIVAGTPVFSPSAGNIAPANGSTAAASRVIGLAAEDIPAASNGSIAYAGFIENVPLYNSLTHGNYLYLGDDDGEVLDTEPTSPTFPAGFNVVILGVIEDDNLFIQINNVGAL